MNSLLQHLQGIHFEFAAFENDLLKIEPAGQFIEIQFLKADGFSERWYQIKHPFLDNFEFNNQAGWNIRILATRDTPDELKISLVKGAQKNELLIVCTDNTVCPKPIRIIWN